MYVSKAMNKSFVRPEIEITLGNRVKLTPLSGFYAPVVGSLHIAYHWYIVALGL